MSNRLNDIFSNDAFNIGGKLRFKDDEAYKNFLAALEIVQAEGKVVPVEGVTSISTEISDEAGKYIIDHSENVLEFMVGPSKEEVKFPIKIENTERYITFQRYSITDNVVLETPSNAIVFLKVLFCISKQKLSIIYKINLSYANTIEELIDSYACASAFLTAFLEKKDKNSGNEEVNSFLNLIKYFKHSESFFRRLHAVEIELGKQIAPLKINDITTEIQDDVEELYILLCQKNCVRLNAKLTSSDSTIINAQTEETNKFIIGSAVKLTFMGENTYNLFDDMITLKTVNLLVNAIIKEIHEDIDTTKILYGDSDSNPMYVSYSAFKSETEAKEELKLILEHEDKYIHALTLNDFKNSCK